MKHEMRSEFKSLFESMNLGKCSDCVKCDAKIKEPLMPWFVGDKFYETDKRILFYGKPHRGCPGDLLPSGLIDPTVSITELVSKKWPYFSYTKEIGKRIFGGDGVEYLAMSNIIKCTNVGHDDNSSSIDLTSHSMALNCISKNEVIFKEMEIIKPKTIVFYTYNLYKDILIEALKAKYRRVYVKPDRVIACGMKWLHFIEIIIESEGGSIIKSAITGHPERLNKNEYCNIIVDWVMN